jgi:ATP-dependent RNA helicase DeaD
MDWKDVIAKAPTGTGKTFAFGIPMVEHIDPDATDVLALVLAPTRELAIQIQDELRDLCQFKEGVRTVCLYGGAPIDKQINALKKRPQIVVATPGRLMDHMKRRTVRLDKVETVVLDEADRMLDMGFVRDVTHILDKMPQRKNLGMFSATISREVMDISWVYQRDPVEITVRADEQNKPDIKQYRIQLPGRGEKLDAMERILIAEGYDRAIVFCNTKNMTDRLAGLLQMRGFSAQCIHGDIQQRVREKTLQSFRDGKLKLLIATDVAARGLDIDDVDAVFNYDVPDEIEYYIHRIGRTGRAKRHGVAYSLVSTVTEGVRLDEIAKITHSDIEALKFDEDGCLVPVNEGN